MWGFAGQIPSAFALARLTDLSFAAPARDKVTAAMVLVMAAVIGQWRYAVVLLMLGAIVALVLFLALRPLRLESPASQSGRALLRLDTALGATVEPITPGKLVVTSVATHGPAANAGLRVGDVIERIAGRSAAQASQRGGFAADAPLTIRRGGKPFVVTVRLAAASG
jgi:hypothetical protein